jgi:hypothetical protein
MKLDGYVEINPQRILSAVNYYDNLVKKNNDFYILEKEKLKNTFSYKFYMFKLSEWDKCHTIFGFIDEPYLKKNHSAFAAIYFHKRFNHDQNTVYIRSLATECTNGVVLCNANIALFVDYYALPKPNNHIGMNF